MPEYTKFGKAWKLVKENPGDILRYLAVPTGVLSGGITYYTTGDAVSAEKAMQIPAIMFTIGEGINAAKYWGGNIFEKAGKIASVAAPAVASYFLGDNSYNPGLTLGMIAPWGLAKGAEKIGDNIETKKLEKRYLETNKDVILKELGRLPKKDLARLAARTRKK